MRDQSLDRLTEKSAADRCRAIPPDVKLLHMGPQVSQERLGACQESYGDIAARQKATVVVAGGRVAPRPSRGALPRRWMLHAAGDLLRRKTRCASRRRKTKSFFGPVVCFWWISFENEDDSRSSRPNEGDHGLSAGTSGPRISLRRVASRKEIKAGVIWIITLHNMFNAASLSGGYKLIRLRQRDGRARPRGCTPNVKSVCGLICQASQLAGLASKARK